MGVLSATKFSTQSSTVVKKVKEKLNTSHSE